MFDNANRLVPFLWVIIFILAAFVFGAGFVTAWLLF